MLKKHQTVARCRATVFIKFSSIIKDPASLLEQGPGLYCLNHLTITTGWFYYIHNYSRFSEMSLGDISVQLPKISNNFPSIAKNVLRHVHPTLKHLWSCEPFLMAFKHIAQIFGHCYKKETEKITHKIRHEVTLF